MSVVKEFEKRFSDEVEELLILTNESVGGASVYDDMLKPSLNFVASINIKNGELSTEKGRLEWMIKNSPDRVGWGYNFKQFKIYHIKARKSIPVELKEYMDGTVNNCYMVMEVIEEDASEPRLDKIKEEISKPVIIDIESIGRFVLKREFSCFDGKVEWLDNVCLVVLETDEEDGNTAEKAVETLKELYKDRKSWDDRFRKYSSEKLTELANEWLEQDDCNEESIITEEEFAERIEISELVIRPDGDFTLYYNDDDMFCGHAVQIEGNINGEISDADMV